MRWFGQMMLFFIASLDAVVVQAEDCPDLFSAAPARLVVDERQLKRVGEMFATWKGDEQARLVKFGAYVTKSGRTQGICCMSSTFPMSGGASRKFVRRVSELRFEPATHDEEPIDVFVLFTAFAQKTEDGEIVTRLLTNHLRQMQDYGLNYSAPQRIRKQSLWLGKRLNAGNVKLEITTIVDENGHARDTHVSSLKNSSGIDGALTSRVERSCYVPGKTAEGPTEMTYVEQFSSS